MRRSTLQFKARFNRAQNAMERRGIRMAYSALRMQYQEFVDQTKNADPNNWLDLANFVNSQPIRRFLENYYRMAATLALLQRKFVVGEKALRDRVRTKAEGDNVYLSIYEQHMLDFLDKYSGDNIRTITATSVDSIKKVIRQTLTESEVEGLGIPEIQTRLEKLVGANLRGNARARARAIAQTEMIKASNEASKFAVDSTGLEYRKFWSSSHLPGTRASHIEAEQDSIARGGLLKHEYHSNGLLYVGDPAGPADQIINCRCTELYEVS